MLHSECVCSTAPAPRARTISRCRRASADGRGDRACAAFPSASISRISAAVRSPFHAPLAVIASRSGSRVITALKLPLVPGTQPRASKRRPASASRRAISESSAAIADQSFSLPAILPRAEIDTLVEPSLDSASQEAGRFETPHILVSMASRPGVVGTALRRGLRKRCPHCGEGPLFSGWSHIDRCSSCGLVFVHNPGDTWAFTIIGDRVPIGAMIVVDLFRRRARASSAGHDDAGRAGGAGGVDQSQPVGRRDRAALLVASLLARSGGSYSAASCAWCSMMRQRMRCAYNRAARSSHATNRHAHVSHTRGGDPARGRRSTRSRRWANDATSSRRDADSPTCTSFRSMPRSIRRTTAQPRRSSVAARWRPKRWTGVCSAIQPTSS